MKRLKIPESAMRYFRLTGSRGGKTRSARYSKEQLSAWGRMGGRPKASSGKTTRGGKK